MGIDCRYLDELEASAVDAIVAEVGGKDALLVLLPEAESGRVPWLQERARGLAGRFAGAVFPLLIHQDALLGRGGLFLLLRDTPCPCLLEGADRTGEEASAARALADYVETALAPEQDAALWLIFDTLNPNIHSLLDASYLELADRVHYFGLSAGSETFQPVPCLFDERRFVQGGVLAMLLPGHPGAALLHGFPQPEHLVAATSAEGNRIVQIDWRPALEVYRELLLKHYGVELSRENFYSLAVHFPFGIVRADGEMLVRLPVAVDDAGALVCVGEIPPNAVLTLLDARDVAADTPERLARALCTLNGSCHGDLLLFYCAGRRLQRGEAGMQAELRAVMANWDAPQLYGALSLGEIGSSQSGAYPLFHNTTLVGVPCRTQ